MSRVEVRARLRGEEPLKPAEPEWRPSRAAWQLALACRIERAIEAGELRDYADAARRLGLTRGRVAQLIRVAVLTSSQRQRILDGPRPRGTTPSSRVPRVGRLAVFAVVKAPPCRVLHHLLSQNPLM